MSKAKSFLKVFLGLPLGIIAFIFIGKILFDFRATIFTAFLNINLPLFLIGVLFFSVFFAIKSFVWIQILNKKGFRVNRTEANFSYTMSELKRFVPGNVFAFAARINTLSKEVPKKETLKGIGIEATLLVLSALISSIPAIIYPLYKTSKLTHISIFLSITAGIVLLLIILAVIFSKFRKNIASYFDSFLLFILAWLFYAVGSFLVAVSFTYIYPSNFIFILSYFVLSWLVGYLTFVVPMGLGVRELAITGSLSLFLPVSFASVIAILERIAMILGEVIYLFISYFIYKLRKTSKLFKINPYFSIVVVLAFFYFLYFSIYTIQRHNVYLSGRFDLGNMSQTVWNTANGNFFMLTNPDGTEQISRLADHSDILLVFFAPLYLIWSDPRMLLLVQSLALALGGIFVYKIAKIVLNSDKLSFIIAVSYFFNFWIHEENIFDFHAVAIGTTLLLATFYFLLKKRYILFSLFLFLSVLTKENVFLVASVFGMYLIIKERKWLVGILLTVIPTVIFFYLITKAIPQARGNVHFALSYYSYIGDSTHAIIENLILKPQLVFGQIFSFSTLLYFHELLIPTGYLSIFSPLYLIFALPDLLINLLSNNANLRSYYYHYGAIIVPFVYISTIFGIDFLIKKFKKYRVEKFIFYYIIAAICISTYFYSPLPGMLQANYKPYEIKNTQRISQYLSIIPQNASVSASNSIGAHLSHRNEIYVIPNAINSAQYVVLYNENKNTVNSVNSIEYRLLVHSNNFYIFKRKTPSACFNCMP